MVDRSRPPASAPLRLNRRKLVQGGAAAAGLAAALPAQMLSAQDRQVAWKLWQAEHPDATPISVEDYQPVALSAGEWATLTAVVNRFFPKADDLPGGAETGAHIYIDRKLTTAYAASLPAYQTGLAAIEASIDGGFAHASAEEQDRALTDIEAGKHQEVPAGFFMTLLSHTRQGMFCDPIHGGNREFLGWDLIGYPGIKLVWTAEDQAIDAVVEPQHVSVAQYGGAAR